MFQQRRLKKRKASARALLERTAGRQRQLRVERMEGRLMLSATSIETPTADIKAVQFMFDNAQFESFAGQFSNATASRDGGFISLDSMNTFVLSNFQPQAPVVLSSGAYYTVFQGTVNYSDADTDLWSYGGFPNFGDTRLEPSVIPPKLESGPVAMSNTGQTVSSVANPIHSGEGGAIAIPQLLASLQQESLSSGARSLSRIAGAKPPEGRSNLRASAASTSVISGELARATVFEVVGATRHDRLHAEDGGTLQIRSMNTSGQADDSVSGVKKLGGASEGSDPSARQRNPRPVDGSVPTDRTSHSPPMGPTNGNVTVRDSVEAIVDATHIESSRSNLLPTSENAVLDGVVRTDSAFNDLGLQSAALDFTLDRNLWSSSRTATPLLLILAIERIAAYNSCHSSRRRDSAENEHTRRSG